jgi:DNA polymerase I
MRPIYLDFEYNESQERRLNLVCASYRMLNETRTVWLHNDLQAQRDFANFLDSVKDEFRIVCFGGLAEARSLISLGLNPLDFKWIDLWVTWKMMQNNCDKFKYGTYFHLGQKKCSRVPHRNKKMNLGKDCREIGQSMDAVVARLLEVDIGKNVKDAMRNLILENRPNYGMESRRQIMNYCESDLIHLPNLWRKMVEELVFLTKLSRENLFEIQEELSEDVVSMALCEAEGYPIDFPRLRNLNANTEFIKNAIIERINEDYPFYVRNKQGAWVEKYAAFAAFVEANFDAKTWPKTESGKYASDEDSLERYCGNEVIRKLRGAKKDLGQLKWFRDENWPNFLARMGSDFHVRPYLNPYGTQTGRNAPPAKAFVPAMSSWLRSLIRPEPGWAITALDWEAQEFGIAACLSGDGNMRMAYASGDPYSWFAKYVKAMPAEGTKATHPKIRDLFKSTVLGLQYLMGDEGLAVKLSADTGRDIPVSEAAKLSGYHKRIFSKYWRWLDKTYSEYVEKGRLWLENGWHIFGDNDNQRSIKNAKVQGMGAVMMRRACRYAQREGVRVLFPLHDAVYIYHPEGDTKAIQTMKDCMNRACSELLDGFLLRIEDNTYTHEKLYLEKKGMAQYKAFSQFLDKDFTAPEEVSGEVDTQTTLGLGE